jgi:NAD(P)-dependent dehydrogenase (short-subunit alcohol dehydrogenase family)
MTSLPSSVAIVTGGGQGIGRVIGLRLAAAGADVVVAGPNRPELDATAKEIHALGQRSLAIVTDVTNEDQVSALAEQTQKELGSIDVLVNNAAIIGPTALVMNIGRPDWDEVLAVNLTGPFLCCRAVLPFMIAQHSGRIINIASIAGKIAYARRSPYAVSKWGLIGLTMTLAKEVGEHNVLVNAVCPGPVAGERIRRVIEQRAAEMEQSVAEVEASYLEAMVLKRMVTADDVAALVVFLASPAAANITGQALDVAAGYGL